MIFDTCGFWARLLVFELLRNADVLEYSVLLLFVGFGWGCLSFLCARFGLCVSFVVFAFLSVWFGCFRFLRIARDGMDLAVVDYVKLER
jgi:hypothetical protein